MKKFVPVSNTYNQELLQIVNLDYSSNTLQTQQGNFYRASVHKKEFLEIHNQLKGVIV